MKAPLVAACPCGSQLSYAACCAPLHDGLAAPDAAALMRSRYSAYVLAIDSYLLATWHASTRPQQVAADDPAAAPKWLALEVRRHLATGPETAIVEFVARYRVQGRAYRLHEISRFVREAGRWYYVDGECPSTPLKSSRAAIRRPRSADE
ncbi:YchJ family metal-binding protein [Candidatus Accumulibacter sp. ACC003]|uniref:YchJ family protein n=1 Tax=Candidatus Accumulibacter sp. ACC003 TaxID=2823334 RepID=UPI0025C67E20|nr:YchJ family metal-binding protein [Candidatus Accumulibacter sp. ACC003]